MAEVHGNGKHINHVKQLNLNMQNSNAEAISFQMCLEGTSHSNSDGLQRSRAQVHQELKEGMELFRSSLKNEYSTVGSRLSRLPWVEHDPIEDFYVDLMLQKKSRSGIYVNDQNLRYEDIFKEKANRVVLVAEAGYGKTTLLTKIAKTWAEDDSSQFQKFQSVLFLSLKDINKGESFREALRRFCESRLSHDFPQLDLNIFLRDGLQESLVLLDGYDELSDEDQASVKNFLDHNPPVFRGTVLVSTRPGVHSSFFELFSRVVAIRELSDCMREKLIDLTFPKDEKKSEEVKDFIVGRGDLFQAGLSPLLLYAICFVFKTSDPSNVNNTQDLIFVVTKTFLRRTAERLSLNIEESDSDGIILSLGKLFYYKIQSRKSTITDSELEQVEASGLKLEERFRIVKNLEIFRNNGNNEFEVIHKLFMEVLSVRYLNSSFQKCDSIEKTEDFLLNFLGDRDTVRTNLVLDKRFPVLMLRGELKEIAYVVKNEQSVLSGTFMFSQDFNDFVISLLVGYISKWNLVGFIEKVMSFIIPWFGFLLQSIVRALSTIKYVQPKMNPPNTNYLIRETGRIEIKHFTSIDSYFVYTPIIEDEKILNYRSFLDALYKTNTHKNWKAIFRSAKKYFSEYPMEVEIFEEN